MTLQHFLVFSAIVFCLGLYAMLARRNLIGVLIGVELMLNAASINFIAFSYFTAPDPVTGKIVVLFIIGLAAAEAAIALAIIVNVYRQRRSIDTAKLTELRG